MWEDVPKKIPKLMSIDREDYGSTFPKWLATKPMSLMSRAPCLYDTLRDIEDFYTNDICRLDHTWFYKLNQQLLKRNGFVEQSSLRIVADVILARCINVSVSRSAS